MPYFGASRHKSPHRSAGLFTKGLHRVALSDLRPSAPEALGCEAIDNGRIRNGKRTGAGSPMTSAEQLALESLSRHVVDTGGERCPRRLVVYLATSVLDLLDDLR